jgi:(S)-2-hydroxyglutarate dehydrogenase
MSHSFDYIILGAGIIGLTIARKLKQNNPSASILILEKEKLLGMHGSGRNSGVLHSGIYYPENSLKAKVCLNGSRAMMKYCLERELPVNKLGKVIVPTTLADDQQIDVLYARANSNGARAYIIDKQELKEIEPFARTASGRALFSPDTAVVDPKLILKQLYQDLTEQGVQVKFQSLCIDADHEKSEIQTKNARYTYGHLINATGQFSDKIAHIFDVGREYVLLPFKGLYYKLSEDSGIHLQRLVYPVPDLKVPFLGVHSVNSIDGASYFGPTAIPALGREHYKGLKGINIKDALSISYRLCEQYVRNQQGFRHFSHEEAGRFIKSRFVQAAQKLVPAIKAEYLLPSNKVGIRAQLLNKNTHKLIMDFLVERRKNSTHVLNAVSPAFTSSFSFADYVVQNIDERY